MIQGIDKSVDVRPMKRYHEIRDKGGILKRLNVRVFFFLRKETRTLVVLGAIKKESDGPTPAGDRITMRRRMRHYLEAYPLDPRSGALGGDSDKS